MQNKKIHAKIVAVFLLALMLPVADPSWAFGRGLPWWHALTAPFVHTNVFHLAANAWALWLMWPSRKESATAYALTALTGLALSPVTPPVLGLSGFLFAVTGLRFRMSRRQIPFLCLALGMGFVPRFAGWYHLACFLLALAWAYMIRVRHEARACGF